MIDLIIKKKQVTAKFNFLALFEANERFSTIDANGNSMQDGAANLFVRLINDEMTVLSDLLSVTVPGKWSREELSEAVDDLTENGDKVDDIMAQFKEEVLASGFFNKAIKKQMSLMEEVLPALEEQAKNAKDKDKADEFTGYAEAVRKQLELMSENI